MSGRKARQARGAADPAVRPQAPRSKRGAPARRGVRSIVLAAVAVVAVAGIVAAVALKGGGSGAVAAVSEGRAPSLTGTDPVTGKPISLASFTGKPVVINIWASWCPGCNEEAADLAKLAQKHPEAQVIGIDYQDTKAGARSFYRRWGWQHPSVFDPSGSLAARYGLVGLPTTVFLDAKHRIVGRITGAGTLADFEAGLRRAQSS